MTHPTLPPRGIFVPTQLIFHPELPSAVLVTWIQLRCLAWKAWVTPPLTITELASVLGIHPNRLYKHLSQLQDISALSLRNTGQRKIIISFPEEPAVNHENYVPTRNNTGMAIHNSMDPETCAARSYFPQKILGYLSFDDDEEGALYGDEYSVQIEGVQAEQAREFSKLTICKPVEHAFLTK